MKQTSLGGGQNPNSVRDFFIFFALRILLYPKFEYLERVIIANGERTGSEIIYEPGSRVRDVEVGLNGNIFVALEDPGRIVRLTKINK